MKRKLDAGQASVTPAARMLSRGGIVITPYRAYVCRLQALYTDGHYLRSRIQGVWVDDLSS